MDKEPHIEPEAPISTLQVDHVNEQCSREISIPSNEVPPHAFILNSSIPNGINGEESRPFNVSDSMIADEHDEGEASLKSFSCVDYLEIMRDEMLHPESTRTSDTDTQEESLIFVCKQSDCNYSTTNMDSYLKHEFEHVDGKLYECDVCHLKFNLFTTMRNHRMSHLSHRPYKCRLCSKEFFRKDILVEHLVKQHSKQRPYRCPFCPKHFKLRPQLKLHLSNEHSAAMLIRTCKLCGFKAVNPNAFRNHFTLCYMKRSRELPATNPCDLSQIHLVSSEANAIDLGAVSQNFSFVPSHYAPFAIVAADGTTSMPGPSDAPPIVPLHTTSARCLQMEREHCANDHHETVTPSRISSLASSTTQISPSRTLNEEFPQNLVMSSIVKSEPSDARVDESQNSSSLPTSTMDLSAGNVETSYNCNDPETSPDLPLKIKAACSTREDRSSINSGSHLCYRGEHSRDCCTTSKVKHDVAIKETICRCNSRHSQCSSSTWNKRERQTDSSSRSGESSQHSARKRVCHNKSTATEHQPEAPTQNEAPSNNPYLTYTRVQPGDCCTDSKSHILAKNKPENSSYTCPFCEIVFPDQTLYFLHRSLHSETHPWKCNLCGKLFRDKYDFNSHIISQGHH